MVPEGECARPPLNPLLTPVWQTPRKWTVFPQRRAGHGAAPTKESGPCQLPRRFFLASTTAMVASAIVTVARKMVMGHLLHLMIPPAVSVVVGVYTDPASVPTRS